MKYKINIFQKNSDLSACTVLTKTKKQYNQTKENIERMIGGDREYFLTTYQVIKGRWTRFVGDV